MEIQNVRQVAMAGLASTILIGFASSTSAQGFFGQSKASKIVRGQSSTVSSPAQRPSTVGKNPTLVTDIQGNKIESDEKLENVRQHLLKAIESCHDASHAN